MLRKCNMTKRRLNPWVKQFLIALTIASLFFIYIGINNYFDNEMEKHIETVSKECASQGYGIKATYTNQGDKFYVCDKDGEK